MKIYQHVDEFNEHDGIGNDILGFHSIAQNLGFISSIVTRINHTKHEVDIYTTENPPIFYSEDIHILHYGGTGYPINFFERIAGKKILRFHNITPVSFFKGFIVDDIFKTFEKNEIKSQLELYSLHDSIHAILHDSDFNQREYSQNINSKKPKIEKVIPVIRNYPLLKKRASQGLRIGFIGRWAPNKKIEDLLFTLYFLKKINKKYTLVLIGKVNQIFTPYNKMLFDLIKELNLSDSIEFYESLSEEEIQAKLLSIDIYLSMSEHEGFGIPILEAMAAEIPVLAFSSTAVIETVKDAGILFTVKNFPLLAELIDKVNSSSLLRSQIIDLQLSRLKIYNQFPFKEKLLEVLKS
jgi:glycosyltransferase involved in cell wall biosynthesis